jgi:predicted kinase
MSTPPNTRSIKIDADERGGWSSDRPRPGGGPPRKDDVSTRCKVLQPSDLLRYSPGSLLVIASPSARARHDFVERLIETKAAVLSQEKVTALLEGKVPEDQLAEQAATLLQAAAKKRLDAGETVVIPTQGLDPEERETYVRLAAANRRPRHLILIEPAKGEVEDEDRLRLNELRTKLDSGQLGQEGFQSALRLGGGSVSELKRLVFRPAPKDD